MMCSWQKQKSYVVTLRKKSLVFILFSIFHVIQISPYQALFKEAGSELSD